MIVHLARPASIVRFQLAEGPIWDEEAQRLLWVDIDAGQVFEGDLAGDEIVVSRQHDIGEVVTTVTPAARGQLLISLRDRLALLGPAGQMTPVREAFPVGSTSRLNDGRCDPAGRFLVGSMALDNRVGGELLLRLEDDCTVTLLDHNLTLSNGLGWSPDGSVLYNVDSIPGVVWGRKYDADTGVCGPRRQQFAVEGGLPDGLAVDTDGNLWIAIWGASQVRCYRPDGDVLQIVEVDAPYVASVCFVGRNRNRLAITTSSSRLAEIERKQHPNAGRFFLANVGATGLPAAKWHGFVDPTNVPS